MSFIAFVKLEAANTLSVVVEFAGDKLTNWEPITSIMLVTAVAIQAISLLLFMKVIVLDEIPSLAYIDTWKQKTKPELPKAFPTMEIDNFPVSLLKQRVKGIE
ncbi:MAG: hypothetical protein V7K55_26910 [Nostoc sp.]|uniref:hypothetical protein n=1 Tax=Nostoc sp. TaxID=1180 RepID=UPI002FF63103